jgi:hypothetical protein
MCANTIEEERIMKTIMMSLVILLSALALVSCSTQWGEMRGGEQFQTEGWVTPDIFRVTATGVPKDGLINKIQRRGTAKEAALIMAQKRILEKFVGARIEFGAGVENYASTGVAVAKEFGGLVKGGTIIKSTYDTDDNCEIVYQIESKGLKSRVEFAASK